MSNDIEKTGLRGRANWQAVSGPNAAIAEQGFFQAFQRNFIDTDFVIRAKPREFCDMYTGIKLSDAVLSEIYNPGEVKSGIIPDYAIDNVKTNKTLYVENKRQDGWVEGKPRSAGRGNAHERVGKFFTPGIQKRLRDQGKLGSNAALPFWAVFQGDIARDPCRVREITCWFENYEAYFFMWRTPDNAEPLLRHFHTHLKHLLL